MHLQELFDYKNQLMEDILTNENIVHLVNETIPFEDAKRLAYKQVFPCEYVPETVQEGKTFICFEVDVQQSINKTFFAPVLYIWVFTHRSKLRAPSGGVLTDILCSEICEVINGSKMYGLGELELYAVKRFAPMTDYQGKMMTFHARDVSKIYTPKKEVPVNRRKGE